MAQQPANVRVSALFPFPAGVAGSAPITITKTNGIWTVSLNVGGLAVQTPPPANYPTDFLTVWDSVAKVWVAAPLSAIIPTVAAYSIALTALVNFNAGNADTQIPIVLPPGYTRFRINSVSIVQASQTLTTATFGVFTAAAGAGTAIVNAGTAVTVNTAADNTNNNSQLVASNNQVTQSYTLAAVPSLFFRVGTAQGAAATGTVIVVVQPQP